MKGFSAFLRKELSETLRTWRIWVLPGILLFFGLMGPVAAKLTPLLLKSFVNSQPGVVFKMPPPTWVDSYAQWVKNLSQLGMFAVLIIAAGVVSAERKSGTAILVLTKPLSRFAFVVAKFVSQSLLLAFSVAVGALATWALTFALFGEAPVDRLAALSGVWLASAVFIVAIMTLLSVLLSSQVGAAGVGLAIFALSGIGALWKPLQRYTPLGLGSTLTPLLQGKHAELAWPLATTALAIVVLVALAALAFRRQEL